MDGRRLVAVVIRGGEEQNPAYRPTRSPLKLSVPRERSVCLTNRLVQFLQRAVELLARGARQLVLTGIQQAVGEGVFARRVRDLGLLAQMRPAHHAVLMVAKQGLDVL